MPTYSKGLIFCLLFLFTARTLLADALPDKIRLGLYPDKIRIVILLEKAPDFQVNFFENPPALKILLFNAPELQTLKMPPPPSPKGETLFQGLEIAERDFQVKSLILPFGYWVPPANFKVFPLLNPDRLVIDILRDFEINDNWQLSPEIALQLTEKRMGNSNYLKIARLTIKPDPKVKFDLALAQDCLTAREATSKMVQRYDALAGINGGFFARQGGPLGLVLKDQNIIAPPVGTRPPRTALGITPDNQLIFSRIKIEDNKLIPIDEGDWSKVQLALGGGPRILTDGKITLTTEDEALGKDGNDITRPAGRTAVGVAENGEIVFLTVRGFYDGHKDGITLEELAQILKAYRLKDAMALDGGNSTTMIAQGKAVSFGRGNLAPETKVATALLVNSTSPILSPQRIELESPITDLNADGIDTLPIIVRVKDAKGEDLPDGTLLFFNTDLGSLPESALLKNGKAQIEFLSQKTAGTANLNISCGAAELPLRINLMPGAPARAFCSISPDPEEERSFLLQILLTDQAFNPLPGQLLVLSKLEGKGEPAVEIGETDYRGIAAFLWVKGEIGDSFSLRAAKSLILKGGISPGISELNKAEEDKP